MYDRVFIWTSELSELYLTGCLFYLIFFTGCPFYVNLFCLTGFLFYLNFFFLSDRVPGWGNTSSMEFISKSSWGFATYFSPIVEVLRWNWNIVGAWYKNLVKQYFVQCFSLSGFGKSWLCSRGHTFRSTVWLSKGSKRARWKLLRPTIFIMDSNSTNRWILQKA